MLDDFILNQITEDVTSYYCVTCFYFNNTPVFHLALSNMVQRHVPFCERHVALHERHVALHECHGSLQVRYVAFLIIRQCNASLNYCYVIFNTPRPL